MPDPIAFPDDLHTASAALGLSVDNDEIKETYQHKFLRDGESGPVVGIAVYDVRKLAAIARGRQPDHAVSIDGFIEMVQSKRQFVDVEYAKNLTEQDLAKPLLVIEVRHPTKNVVYSTLADGAHRLYRAWQLGKKSLPAITLSLAEADACKFPDELVRALVLAGEIK